jgi:hypothetical protein
MLCNFLLVPFWYPISGYPLTMLTLIEPWRVFTQFLATSQFLLFLSFRLFLFIQFSFQLCLSNFKVFIFFNYFGGPVCIFSIFRLLFIRGIVYCPWRPVVYPLFSVFY